MDKINPVPLYHRLFAEMGPQHWWPADTKTEIVIGAILVQNTNWNNVDLALDNLRRVTNLEPARILKLPMARLQQLIRPSGFYVNKAKSLMGVLTWFAKYQEDFTGMVTHYGTNLRRQLLKLPGIGEETADSLLVYVFNQPTFIADKYARNLFGYLGFQGLDNYTKLKRRIILPADFSSQDAKEFHGLIDEFGKRVKTEVQFQTSFLSDFTLKLTDV